MVDVLELNEEKKNESKKSMDAKVTGIISYLSIVGWIIAHAAGDKEGAKFHLNQSLILNVGYLICSILSRLGRPVRYIGWIAELVISILWIIGFIAAVRNEEKKVPLIGEIQILK